MNLHGEGAEVDKDDPTLLQQLKNMMKVIAQCDPEHIYNVDETGLFC